MAAKDHNGVIREADLEQANDAFELYYNLGPVRTFKAVAHEMDLPVDQIIDWAHYYEWDRQIIEKDDLLEQEFEARHRRQVRSIRNRLTGQVNKILDQMEASSLGLPFDVSTPQDFQKVANAYETLAKASSLVSRPPGPGTGRRGQRPQGGDGPSPGGAGGDWATLLTEADGNGTPLEFDTDPEDAEYEEGDSGDE